MKKLLIILMMFTSLLFAENTILFSGLSKHGSEKDRFGDKFNSVHAGIGYVHSDYSRDEVFCTTTLLIMEDSHKNVMYSISYGINYMFLDENAFRFSVGTEVGLTYRKIKYRDFNDKIIFDYSVLPIAFIPKATIEYKRISVNFAYVPNIDFRDLIINEVLYMNVGYRF